MLNSFVFNGAEYNFAIPTNTNNIVFSFNGFNFFNDNIWLTAFDDKAPKADILRHRRSYSDGYLFARKTHSDKTITIRGVIKAKLGYTLDQTLDDLYKMLNIDQAYFIMTTQSGEQRKILATWNNEDVVDRKSYDITQTTFTIVFNSTEPFWQDIAETESSILDAITTPSYTFDYQASAPSGPKIIINGVHGCMPYISINGKTITSKYVINADDVIVDFQELSWKADGDDIPRSGVMTKLNLGSNTIEIGVTGLGSFDDTWKVLYSNRRI